MADKVPTICPECAKQFQIPQEIVGRKIRCKNCGKAFVAKAAADVGLSAKKPDPGVIAFKDDDDDEGDGKPYEVTSADLSARCPSCANELENEEDAVCLHCGFNLKTRTVAETKRVKDITGGDIFMWLLPGICAAVFFFICFGLFDWIIIYRLFIHEWEKEDSQIWKNCVNGLHLWLCLLMVYLMWRAGKYAVIRLIINNKPPEVEVS